MKPRAFERKVESPCINVCRMSTAGDYCIGCRRTRDEIARWWQMSEIERAEVLARLDERRR